MSSKRPKGGRISETQSVDVLEILHYRMTMPPKQTREGKIKKRLHVPPNSSATLPPLFFNNLKCFFNCCRYKLFVSRHPF